MKQDDIDVSCAILIFLDSIIYNNLKLSDHVSQKCLLLMLRASPPW